MTKYAFIASEFIYNMIPSLYFNNNQQLYYMHFLKTSKMMPYCTYIQNQDIWFTMQWAAVHFAVICFTV